MQYALTAAGDLAHVIVIAHTEHHGILILGCFRGRCGHRAAELILPALRALKGAIKYRHRVPAGREVPCHGVAHGAQANECNAFC